MVMRPDRSNGRAVFARNPWIELRQRLDQSIDAGLRPQLGQSLAGGLLQNKFIAPADVRQ